MIIREWICGQWRCTPWKQQHRRFFDVLLLIVWHVCIMRPWSWSIDIFFMHMLNIVASIWYTFSIQDFILIYSLPFDVFWWRIWFDGMSVSSTWNYNLSPIRGRIAEESFSKPMQTRMNIYLRRKLKLRKTSSSWK